MTTTATSAVETAMTTNDPFWKTDAWSFKMQCRFTGQMVLISELDARVAVRIATERSVSRRNGLLPHLVEGAIARVVGSAMP